MRTIKFRVWEQNQKRWCWSTEVTLEGSGQVVHHHYPKNGYDYAKDKLPENMIGCGCLAPIQQSTGLLDKNGKEIFEGDIIDQYHGIAPYVYPNFQKRRVVEWRNHSQGTGFNITERGTPRIEVIGNIHESPELLKEGTL